MSWGSEQPCVVAAAGPSAWATVAAALVAAGGDRVAAVVVGASEADLLRSVATTYVAVPVAARADDVVRIATALVSAHDRVVVTAAGGLLAPLGGFTLADVAWALRAPVVVAADPGPAAANEVALTVEVLERRHVAAAVVAVGSAEHLAELPVALAGEIPSDAHEHADFASHAAEWLDPLLVGERSGSPSDGDAAPAPAAPTRVLTGKRVAIALLILTIAALQALYMISLFGDDPPAARSQQEPLRGSVEVRTARAVPVPPPPATTQNDRCSPEQLTPVSAQPDAATTARVNAAWTRIEAALAAKAPAAARSLRPGATRQALLTAQARMSVAFPADLQASLLRHDGAVPAAGFRFPPLHRYAGLDEIYSNWLSTCRVLARIGEGGDWWHRQFVPFAVAGDGGQLVLDQRPGMGGRVGDYYTETGTRFENQPQSLTALLEAVASSLETGTPYAGRYRPTVTPDGGLDWVP
jgi:cell wall assembly regulator SMI1